MDLDAYEPTVLEMANVCQGRHCSSVQLLEERLASSEGSVRELIALRLALAPSRELEDWRGFRQLGFFSRLSEDDRLGLSLVGVDIENVLADRQIDLDCQEYQPGQPLFQRYPYLFNLIRDPERKKELISSTGFGQIDEGSIVEHKAGLAYLSPYLNPKVVAFSFQFAGKRPLFLRLEPHRVPEKLSDQILCENVIRPADPRWIHELNLHKNRTTGSRYDLDPKDDPWGYAVRGVRRLEVFAKREENGRFSMMVEELAERPRQPFLLGRCIHLDTFAYPGTAFADVVLDHIDLAINVYRGEARETRLNQNLAELGKVVDAVPRTHLLRMDQAPFPILFAYAWLFFVSGPLVAEWSHDQFGPERRDATTAG
jgi:hypothetical protein